MKKLFIISALLFFIIEEQSIKAQKSGCILIDGVLKNELALKTYNAIRMVGMEKRLYCTGDGKCLFGFKNNLNGYEELQIGFYYTVESVENNTYNLRKDFASKCKKIYNEIKEKDKKKPLVSSLFYFQNGNI